MKDLRIGVIGCGQWGANFVRVLQQVEGFRLAGCCDAKSRNIKKLPRFGPEIPVFKSVDRMLGSVALDAVVVATPAVTHHKLVTRLLKAGLDVLVEKPLATRSADAAHMLSLARARKRILMVGHIFHYNRAVDHLKGMIDSGKLGALRYIYSVRTNLGPIRGDVNVLWDLASHDVSLFLHLTGHKPDRVTAGGQSYLRAGIADVAFATLSFKRTKVICHLHVSWLDPHKVRSLTVIGTEKMAVFDDVNTQEPIRIFDQGVIRDKHYDDFGHFQLVLRDGDIGIPHVAMDEPLRAECNHFLECVRKRVRPVTSAEHGLEVVKVLEAMDESLRKRGRPVKVG